MFVIVFFMWFWVMMIKEEVNSTYSYTNRNKSFYVFFILEAKAIRKLSQQWEKLCNNGWIWYQDEKIRLLLFSQANKHFFCSLVKWEEAYDFDVWFSLQINKLACKRFMLITVGEMEQIENVKKTSNRDLREFNWK